MVDRLKKATHDWFDKKSFGTIIAASAAIAAVGAVAGLRNRDH